MVLLFFNCLGTFDGLFHYKVYWYDGLSSFSPQAQVGTWD